MPKGSFEVWKEKEGQKVKTIKRILIALGVMFLIALGYADTVLWFCLGR